MHRFLRKAVLVIVVSILILFAFTLLVTTNIITNVSAVGTQGVGVYSDSNCRDNVSSIDWGNLTPSSVKSIIVYIRNEVEEPIYLIMSTENWKPSKTSNYIILRWDYTKQQIAPGDVLQTTLTLVVSRDIKGISNFSFDIRIAGSPNLPGDVNGNGIIDIGDIAKLDLIYSETPPYTVPPYDKSHPELYYPLMPDINGDGEVKLGDIVKLNLIYSNIL